MLRGAYSETYKQIEKERQSEKVAQVNVARERARLLSIETNKRRRALFVKRLDEERKEEERRNIILNQRREWQKEATIKFQKAHLPADKRESVRSRPRSNTPPSHVTVEDALKAIEQYPSSFRSSSVPASNRFNNYYYGYSKPFSRNKPLSAKNNSTAKHENINFTFLPSKPHTPAATYTGHSSPKSEEPSKHILSYKQTSYARPHISEKYDVPSSTNKDISSYTYLNKTDSFKQATDSKTLFEKQLQIQQNDLIAMQNKTLEEFQKAINSSSSSITPPPPEDKDADIEIHRSESTQELAEEIVADSLDCEEENMAPTRTENFRPKNPEPAQSNQSAFENSEDTEEKPSVSNISIQRPQSSKFQRTPISTNTVSAEEVLLMKPGNSPSNNDQMKETVSTECKSASTELSNYTSSKQNIEIEQSLNKIPTQVQTSENSVSVPKQKSVAKITQTDNKFQQTISFQPQNSIKSSHQSLGKWGNSSATNSPKPIAEVAPVPSTPPEKEKTEKPQETFKSTKHYSSTLPQEVPPVVATVGFVIDPEYSIYGNDKLKTKQHDVNSLKLDTQMQKIPAELHRTNVRSSSPHEKLVDSNAEDIEEINEGSLKKLGSPRIPATKGILKRSASADDRHRLRDSLELVTVARKKRSVRFDHNLHFEPDRPPPHNQNRSSANRPNSAKFKSRASSEEKQSPKKTNDDENFSLRQTPTDEEINMLWESIKFNLAAVSPPQQPPQASNRSSSINYYARMQQDSGPPTVSKQYFDGNSLFNNNRAATAIPVRRQPLLHQRKQQGANSRFVPSKTNTVQTTNVPYQNFKTNDVAPVVEQNAYSGPTSSNEPQRSQSSKPGSQMSESLLQFISNENAFQMSEAQIEAALTQLQSRPITMLSIEEQRVVASLEKLNEMLKTAELNYQAKNNNSTNRKYIRTGKDTSPSAKLNTGNHIFVYHT